jgi:hypothetical protein
MRGEEIKEYTDRGELPPEYRPGMIGPLSRIPFIRNIFQGESNYPPTNSGLEDQNSGEEIYRETSSKGPFDYAPWMNRALGVGEMALGAFLMVISTVTSARGASGPNQNPNTILYGLGSSMNLVELAAFDAIQEGFRRKNFMDIIKKYPLQIIVGASMYAYDAATTYYGFRQMMSSDELAIAAAISLLFATELLLANGSQRVSGSLDR